MSLLVGERVWLDEEEKLREQLQLLREECGATSLKVSTEDAGMGYDEIRTVHRLFHDILAIQAKIPRPPPPPQGSRRGGGGGARRTPGRPPVCPPPFWRPGPRRAAGGPGRTCGPWSTS